MSLPNFKTQTKWLVLIIASLIVLLSQFATSTLAEFAGGGGGGGVPPPTTCTSTGTATNPLGILCPPGGIPTEAASLGALITFGIKILIFIGFLLAFIYLLIGGINYITSSGEPTKTAAAQKKIIYAIVGLVIIILAFSILTLIERVFTLNPGSITSPQLPF